MKAGDKVTVADGSYTLSVSGNELKPDYGTTLQARGVHTIIAVNCVLPSSHKEYAPEGNDTIIRSSNGTITLIKQEFLRLVASGTYCSHCGHKLDAS